MMMKKLLGLVLVLAVVSTAYGDVEVTVTSADGTTTVPWQGQDVEPSEIITMNLLEPGMLKPFSTVPEFSVAVDHGDLVALRLTPPQLGTIALIDPEGDGFAVRGGATYIFVDAPDGIALGFDFHVPEDLQRSDWINIGWEGNYGGLVPEGIAIHVIPEPMTIGLLGFGALALLRRRK